MSARRLAAVIGVAVLACAAAPRADAGPVSAEARRRAEEAFVAGRPEDLDAILGTGTTPADQEPLFVRDVLWRPAPTPPPLPADDGSLSMRRIRWCVEAYARGVAPLSGYPRAADGETDPYPRLTALVLDRALREERGADGLPDASPLAAVPDETLRWFVTWFYRPAFSPADRVPDPVEREETARTARAAARNRWLAIGAVGGLVLLATAAVVGLGRPRKATGVPTDP